MSSLFARRTQKGAGFANAEERCNSNCLKTSLALENIYSRVRGNDERQ
jgi:hypothetical protein